jgi:hypothetical protein
MNTLNANPTHFVAPHMPKAPDPIIAEVWETKRRINADAGYDIGRLIEMTSSKETEARIAQIRAQMV